MTDRFDACLPHILHHEGGWADHPKDPGGATMKGITLAVFREWTGKQSTKAELKAISDNTVAAIYRKNYWFPSHCDKLPAGVDLIVFDLAVNSGPGRARRSTGGRAKPGRFSLGAFPLGLSPGVTRRRPVRRSRARRPSPRNEAPDRQMTTWRGGESCRGWRPHREWRRGASGVGRM